MGVIYVRDTNTGCGIVPHLLVLQGTCLKASYVFSQHRYRSVFSGKIMALHASTSFETKRALAAVEAVRAKHGNVECLDVDSP